MPLNAQKEGIALHQEEVGVDPDDAARRCSAPACGWFLAAALRGLTAGPGPAQRGRRSFDRTRTERQDDLAADLEVCGRSAFFNLRGGCEGHGADSADVGGYILTDGAVARVTPREMSAIAS